MGTNAAGAFCFKPFDNIAGDTIGLATDAGKALEIIDQIKEADESTYYNDFHPPLAKYYRELSEDILNSTKDNGQGVDVDYYTGLLEDHCQDLLPDYCAFSWEDGELRVVPCVENATEELEHYVGMPLCKVDEHGEETDQHDNPGNDEHAVEVNDHGNVTLWRWQESHDDGPHWAIVWEAV